MLAIGYDGDGSMQLSLELPAPVIQANAQALARFAALDKDIADNVERPWLPYSTIPLPTQGQVDLICVWHLTGTPVLCRERVVSRMFKSMGFVIQGTRNLHSPCLIPVFWAPHVKQEKSNAGQ